MIQTAQYSAVCPLCSRWIAQRRSKVVELPTAILPRASSDGRFSLDDGESYYSGKRYIDATRTRSFAHWYCVPRLDTVPAYVELSGPYDYQIVRTGEYIPILTGTPRDALPRPPEPEVRPPLQTVYQTATPPHNHPIPSTATMRKSCDHCLSEIEDMNNRWRSA